MNYTASKIKTTLSFYWPLFFLALVLYTQQAWLNGFFHDGYLYATLGKNAALKGHWLVPHYTEEVHSRFFHHLPLIFILEGIFFKLFGISNTTARLFVSGFSLATLTLLIYWHSKQKDEKENWWPWMAAAIFLLIPPLIKKSRFVNLDIPLMFFMTASLFFYWRAISGHLRHYFTYGIFFGLSLLTKGPIGLLLPMITTTHLYLMGGLKNIFNKYLFFATMLGFLIFGIWPLALNLTDNFDIFLNYLDFTFLRTIKDGRDAQTNKFFLYFIFLLKQCTLWFLLAVFTTWQCIKDFNKKKKNSLLLLFVCSFWITLLSLSLFKHKYSHYLIPSYPAMAALAGYSALRLSNKWKQYLYDGLKVFSLMLALVLLIFPITTNIRRDLSVFKILALTNHLPIKPKQWVIVNNSLPFYNTVGVLAWERDIPVSAASDTKVSKWNKKNLLLIINRPLWKKWKNSKNYKNKWRVFAVFSNKNLVVLLDNNLWNKDRYFKIL